jgi:hypothetical protein
MALEGRLKKLEAWLRPDPDAEWREESFRRQAAILDAYEDLIRVQDGGLLKDQDPQVTEGLIEAAVPQGLLNHGLSGAEVAELTPAYVALFKEYDRDLEHREPGEEW